MADFLMPALGADMETGKLVEWLVKPGDRVHSGQVVAVVETHKGAIDVEIFLDGEIEALAPLDVALPVGSVLAQVRVAGEAAASGRAGSPPEPRPVMEAASPAPAAPAASPAPPAAPPPPEPADPAAAPRPGTEAFTPPAPAGERRDISPAARRRAAELGLAVDGLRGGGVGGAITLADVERAAALRDAEAAPGRRPRGFDPVQMRAAIAAAMARSKREIPHYYLSEPIPMRAALDWLRAHNAAVPVTERLLPAALLTKAVALALRDAPQLNGHLVDGRFRPSAAVHPGIAIALRGGGLIAPALHDAQAKPLPQLMAELAALVQRARAGGLRSSELMDPTITITNLGDQGVASVFGVIYPPQVAIVGFGALAERPWVVDGQVLAMPQLEASLAADHRVSDGHVGAAFLKALSELLQRPEAL